jgi:hypothetical protein
MSSAQGRFMISDPGPYYFTDPQALNQYAYARNNPLRFIDPTGKYFVVSASDHKFYQKALTELYQRPGGRELIKALAGSDRPIFLDRADMDTGNGGDVGVSKAVLVKGTPGIAGIHTTMGTDNNIFTGSLKAPGKIGSALSTGHELIHARDGLAKGESSRKDGAKAMSDGDAPSSDGKKDTLGGSAQKEAEEIMNQKPDMKDKKAVGAEVEEILKSGQEKWNDSSIKVDLCQQNPGVCKQ